MCRYKGRHGNAKKNLRLTQPFLFGFPSLQKTHFSMKLQFNLFASAALFALLFWTCKPEPNILPEPDPVPNYNPIKFSNLAVGQKSRYLNLWGEDYYSGNSNNFGYNDDTLQVKIVGKDAKGYKVEETLHYVGDLVQWFQYDKDSVYHYYLKVSGDTLRISPSNTNNVRSRLFGYQVTVQGIPLAEFAAPKLEIQGWITSLNYCECRRTGYTENYTLFGQTFPRLNILVENSAMAVDGNGETYVYSKAKGIVRFSTYSWWTQSGIGWDLLP